MKTLLIAGLLFSAFSVYAQATEGKKKKSVAKKVETTTTTTAKGLDGVVKKPTEPCDTKEDVLKKLEEEKKKQKAFSLQGGNTGCSIDEKK